MTNLAGVSASNSGLGAASIVPASTPIAVSGSFSGPSGTNQGLSYDAALYSGATVPAFIDPHSTSHISTQLQPSTLPTLDNQITNTKASFDTSGSGTLAGTNMHGVFTGHESGLSPTQDDLIDANASIAGGFMVGTAADATGKSASVTIGDTTINTRADGTTTLTNALHRTTVLKPGTSADITNLSTLPTSVTVAKDGTVRVTERDTIADEAISVAIKPTGHGDLSIGVVGHRVVLGGVLGGIPLAESGDSEKPDADEVAEHHESPSQTAKSTGTIR